MSEPTKPEFFTETNSLLDSMIQSIYEKAPAARYLSTSIDINQELYVRHTIETILRIRLARTADCNVIKYFTKNDPPAARKWARYAEEEMLHDKLFLKDLKSLGINEKTVYNTDPFLATKLLQGYLYYTIEHQGPQGLLSKSYFVEYITKKTQDHWNRNIERSLGNQAVRGAKAHLAYDLAEDHSADVWNVLMTTVKTKDDEARVHYHLQVYHDLFVSYLNELGSLCQIDLGCQAA